MLVEVGTPTDNKDGTYTINLEDGIYWFKAELAGYDDYEGDFEVDGAALGVNFEMQAEIPDDHILVIDPETGNIISNWPTIQDAIDAANPGEIVKIPGGTYVGDVNDDKGVIFSPGTSPDCVTISGSLTVTPTTTFDIEIFGETLCDDYDQIEVTGDLTITNSTLNIILNGYVPNLSDQFIIFIYEGDLTGTFDDILVDNPGVEFAIDYGSGSDNQIVLTTSGIPPAVPLANYAIYFGILLMVTFVVLRFKRVIML